MQFLNRFLEIFFKSEGDRKKLINVVVPSFAIQSSALFIGLVTNFILARGLGAGNYGIFTFTFSIIFPLVNFISFGLGVLTMREIPHIAATQSSGLLKGLHHWSLKLLIPLCIALTLLVMAIVYFLPHSAYIFIYNYRIKNPFIAIRRPVFFASLAIPFYGAMNYYSASLRGLNKILVSQVSDNIIRPLVFLIIMVWLFYFSSHFGVTYSILINVVAFAAGMAYSALVYYKSVDFTGIQAEYDTKKWWKGLGALSLLNGILSIDARLDLLILGLIKNPAQVGIFNIAHKIALTLYFFLAVMNTIIAPSISRMNSLNDKAGMQKMITKTVRWVMIFSLAAGILFISCSKWIMSYFGPGFEAGQPALIIMCVAQLFSISFGPVGLISIMTGHERFNTIATLMSMTVTLLLNVILTPHLGLTGSAIAVAASIIVWNIYLLVKVKKHVGIYSWIYKIK